MNQFFKAELLQRKLPINIFNPTKTTLKGYSLSTNSGDDQRLILQPRHAVRRQFIRVGTVRRPGQQVRLG